MRNSRKVPALAGFGQTLPGVTREFLGRVSWTIRGSRILVYEPAGRRIVLINPCLRLDILHVVRHGVGVHRAVVDVDAAPGVVGPGEGVLHPLLVVSLRKIL